MFAVTLVVMCGLRYATFYKMGTKAADQNVQEAVRDPSEHALFKKL